MSTLIKKFTVSSGTLGTNYKVSDDAIFCMSGTTTLTVASGGNVRVLYYVVGSGAGGKPGTGSGAVGRGGGGGGVQSGLVDLSNGAAYTITVGSGGNANSNGANSSIIGGGVNITAMGGNSDGTDTVNGSTTGATTPTHSNDNDSQSSSGSIAYGNGGISLAIGGIAGKKGTSTSGDANGKNSPSVGGGGGGGYGSGGTGGIGGNGAVILIATDNTDKIQYIEKQLREMNQLPGTMIDQYKQQYTSTMMAGAMWTVLATTLVFYVFTQV